MSFVLYDLIFMFACTLAVVLFLYIKRANLQRQGLLYLYRTRIGLKIIEWTSKKYAKILKPMEYVVITSGYLLMAGIIWGLVRLSIVYLSSPDLARQLKVPVLIPLIPYLPELFKIDFLPPFYFTYWIIIIAIIAIPHEFAHGIFARLNKIKVHATGFGFLGPFLAAFVEPDEKKMNKAPKKAQLAILASGTFANVLMTILFALLMWLFFVTSFSPAGVYFNTYSADIVNTSDIQAVHGFPISNLSALSLAKNETFVDITVNNKTYYTNLFVAQQLISEGVEKADYLVVYEDSPALRARLHGAITHIGPHSIKSYSDLNKTISKYSPGDKIEIRTMQDGEEKVYPITLANKNGRAFLGIGIRPYQSSGFLGWVYKIISQIKDPIVYYESSIGNLGTFIYDLLWWIVIINISVALCNMIPVGIFDGGRFFYITIWGLTGSQKIGERAFKYATWIILALVAALMLKWAFAIM